MMQFSGTKRSLSLMLIALVTLSLGSGRTGNGILAAIALADTAQAAPPSPVSGSCAPPGCAAAPLPPAPPPSAPPVHREMVMSALRASRPAAKAADATPQITIINGRHYRVVRQVSMVASAYGRGEPGVGRWTFTGTEARVGEVAVDPRQVPLGSLLFIRGYKTPYLPADGLLARAEDTGGAIKGDRVDIYMEASLSGFAQFGMQPVQVEIVAPED